MAQLDARAKDRGQILYQLTEVDASIGCEEEQNFAAVERAFGGDQLHVQPVRGDLLLADLHRALLLLLVLSVYALVVLVRQPQHLAQRRHDLTRRYFVAAGGADAEFIAARGVDDDMVARMQFKHVGVKKVNFCVVAKMYVNHSDGFVRASGAAVRCEFGTDIGFVHTSLLSAANAAVRLSKLSQLHAQPANDSAHADIGVQIVDGALQCLHCAKDLRACARPADRVIWRTRRFRAGFCGQRPA